MLRSRLALGALVVVGAACSAPFRTTVVITQQEVQRKVDAKFPLEKHVFLARLALENPEVRLDADDDRVHLDLDASVSVGPLKYPGRVGVAGRLDYDDEQKAIFMRDAEVTRVDIPDLPPEHEPTVRKTATTVVRSALDQMPVHHLEGAKQKTFVKSIDVREGNVVVEVGI